MFQLDIFIHLEAVDRNEWTGPTDERPLTDMGLEQAEHIAASLMRTPLEAILSSPALRCQQSLEPLSRRTGFPIEVVDGFKDTQGYRAPEGWVVPDTPPRDPLGGAQSAGVAYRAVRELAARMPNGRAVLCSYGDIVPALLAFVSGANDIAMPERKNEWGALWSLAVDGESISVTVVDPPAGFPHSDRDYFPLGRVIT